MGGQASGESDATPPSTRALDRGLRLLMSLVGQPAGLSAPELAERNDLSRATTYRLLSTLIARDFVVTDPRQRRYWLGTALERSFLGRESRIALAALAAPEMERLCADTGESVGLHVRSGLDRVVLRKVEPDAQPLRYVIPVSASRSLAAGASGAVLMSEFTSAEIKETFESFKAGGQQTLQPLKLATIQARVDHVRDHGYCEAVNETVEGVASIAAPVRSAEGRVIASLAVSGPLLRFDEARRATAVELIVERSANISESLRID